MVMGSYLLINGLSTQPLALLKRQIRQKALSLTQLFAALLAGGIAVSMAWFSTGYWALVAQTIVAALVTLGLSLWWTGFRPGKPSISTHSMAMLKFGGFIGACNIITFFQISLDSILIGHYCSAEDLGFYSRAYYLRTLPAMYISMAMTDVMIPAFSALAGDKERMAAAYRKSLCLMAFLGCLIGILLGVTAKESVYLIYGSKWDQVVPILIILSFPAAILPIYQTMGWLFIASGKSREMFILTLFLTPIVVLAFCIGIQWGTWGVAMASACLFTVPFPLISLYYAHRAAEFEFNKTLRPLLPILACSFIAAVAGFFTGWAGESIGIYWLVLMFLKIFVCSLTYLVMAFWLVRPLPVPLLERFYQSRFLQDTR
jgi:PST family polysaccharide transporter